MVPRILTVLVVLILASLSTETYAGGNSYTAAISEYDASNEDRYTMVFRGEPLSNVLTEFVRVTGVDLVYDPRLIEEKTIYTTIRNLTVRESLAEVLKNTGLDYITLSSGTIVIVKSSRSDPAYGTLSGRIIDGRTGKPLPGASVYLADARGGTASNQSGFFSIPNILSGNYEIIVSYVGYRPLRQTVTIPVNGETRKQISLQEEPFLIEPIVVTDHNRRMPLQNGASESISFRNDFGYQPGVDPVRGIGIFSGVQFQLPFADLNIQGSGNDDHRFYLDGAPVYHPYSFGHMYSAFSPYAIDRVSVYKAGFDARAGSQISGMVNLSHDVSNRSSNRATVQADPISTNFRADAVTSFAGMPLETMVAARHNIWGVYENPVLASALRDWDYIDPLITNLLMDANSVFTTYDEVRHEADIRFTDIHLGSRLQINPFQSLSYSVYSGYNRIGTQLLNRISTPDPHYPEYMFANDRYKWNNLVTSLRYDGMISARTDIGVQSSYSANTLQHNYRMAGNNDVSLADGASADEAYTMFTHNHLSGAHQSEENRIRHAIVNADITHAASRQLRLSGGVQLDYVETRVNVSDLFYIPALSTTNTTMGSVYSGIDWHPVPNWHVSVSSRLTYVTETDKFYAEPRFNLQYDRGGTAIGYWSIRFAGGIYRQFINQFSVTNAGPSSVVPSVPFWTHAGELTVPKAYHFTPSFVLEPIEGTAFRAEAFGKWQPVSHYISYPKLLLSETDHITQLSDFTEQTRSFQIGGGITVSQRISAINTEILAGYDYTRSEIDMHAQFGRWMPAPWNEPHRTRLMVHSRLSRSFNVYAQWSGSYGRLWGYRQAYYDFMVMHNLHQFGSHSINTPENDRLPDFHQVDAGVQYDQRMGEATLRLRLDLVNVLNRRNVLDYGLIPGGTDGDFIRRSRTIPGFNPTLSIQLSF